MDNSDITLAKTFLVWFDALLEEWFAIEKKDADVFQKEMGVFTKFHEVQATGYKDAIGKVRPKCSEPSVSALRPH